MGSTIRLNQMTLREAFRLLAVVLAVFAVGALSNSSPVSAEEDEHWLSIKSDVFGDKKVVEDSTVVDLQAPVRIDDASLVPISITIPQHVARDVKAVTLIIDKNPAPVAAKFIFGDAAGLGDRMLSTRVRLDGFSDVRAVIEMADGKLFMSTRYVKGIGGCSSPINKDLDELVRNLGKMKLKWFANNRPSPGYQEEASNQSTAMSEAQIMLKHPNFSGMQSDPVNGGYIAAHFLEGMTVSKGDRMVFKLEGGISLSENPNIRFTYEGGGNEPLIVKANDSEGRTFEIQGNRESS